MLRNRSIHQKNHLLWLILFFAVCISGFAAEEPQRLRRSESFLGIHFDFHAGRDSNEIGAHTTREMIESVIDQVHPDFIQIDCKGHPGLSSYPTKVGNPAPGVVKDQLALWRQVTKEHGVALYLHYSGVWDEEAISHHPEWARIDENGKRDPHITSVFGPYADQLLIPQLKELSGVYGVDGVWVDGECWATLPDYGDEVLKKFCETTGIATVPRHPEDPHYFEFMQFCREGFRRYLSHYVDELHQFNPNFQITSNWSFSNLMPEPVFARVDYLSGDYDMQDSVNSARLAGRCLRHQGKPWDLMAWSFSSTNLNKDPNFSTKSIPQLQREAAAVLALGGGFQAYFTQKRDASLDLWQMRLMSQVARFCRDRQPYCHRAESVPQIALLFPTESAYRKFQRPFSPYAGELNGLKGMLQILLDRGYPVDVLMDHQIHGRMSQYPLIVVPEWDFLSETLRSELLDYTQQGGKLLLIGSQTAALFAKELGVEFDGAVERERVRYLHHQGWMAPVIASEGIPRFSKETKLWGELYAGNDPVGSSYAATATTPVGKGQMAAVFFNMGERYLSSRNPLPVELLSSLVKELFPEPMVEVKAPAPVEVVVNRIGGKLAVNLINLGGPHENRQVVVFDSIPAVGPVEVRIRTQQKPRQVSLQPGNGKLPFQFKNGAVRVVLPRLDIHEILVLD